MKEPIVIDSQEPVWYEDVTEFCVALEWCANREKVRAQGHWNGRLIWCDPGESARVAKSRWSREVWEDEKEAERKAAVLAKIPYSLKAAAPDLLEFAKMILEKMESGEANDYRSEAIAVIAKAEASK
jgi:hypothetical protein